MRYFIKQLGEKDCSFACLKMLLAITYKSKKFLLYPQEDIDKTYSFHDISEIAKKEGVTLFGFRFKNKDNLQKQTNLPVLVPIKSGDSLHMVLIYKIKKSKLLIYDPAGKPYWIDFYEFTKIWNGECLEISKVEGSLFKSKKYSFVSKPYKILVPLFQFLSFGCLATALFFIDSKFLFLIPLFLLFAFIICNFIYNRLLVNEMKSFDNTILANLNVELTRDFRSNFAKMNNLKMLLIGSPIQIINSALILVFGLVLLGFNSYINIINFLIVALVSICITFFEKNYYSNNSTNISNYENEILNLENVKKEIMKEKLSDLYKRTYTLMNFINLKRIVIIFLIICLSLIYCAFSGNISINFLLFHTFLYYYLIENLNKFVEVCLSSKEKSYYLSLYQYYSK